MYVSKMKINLPLSKAKAKLNIKICSVRIYIKLKGGLEMRKIPVAGLNSKDLTNNLGTYRVSTDVDVTVD